MAKNEYGYPDGFSPCTCMNGGEGDTDLGGSMDQENGCPCGGDTPIDSLPLAYVYAPSQKFCMLYGADDALAHGTLFEQLYKPMEVYGRE